MVNNRSRAKGPLHVTLMYPHPLTALPSLSKVQILWELCEWQMVDPARFRALLKGEEEAVAWVSRVCIPSEIAD